MAGDANVKYKAPKFTELNDLVNEKFGGSISFATDEWFAVSENLIKATDAVWKEGVFTEFGKWMDGWETRRKQIPGHDCCIIQLGLPGVIYGIDIDTSYFIGNYPPEASIQAACLEKKLPSQKSQMGTAASEEKFKKFSELKSETWEEILPRSPLQPGYKTSCHNYFKISSNKKWTHIQLNIYPDGGVARLRVYGKAVPDWSKISNKIIDLVAAENGGMCVGYSDVHFGHARNLIQPGQSECMADGWETARKPDRPSVIEMDENGYVKTKGIDWAMFRLGNPGIVHKIEIDTSHFKGNYPESCWIEGCYIKSTEETSIVEKYNEGPWKVLLKRKKLSPHCRHCYSSENIVPCGVISHVRLTIAMDGGISRFRIWGHCQNSSYSKL